MYISSTIKETGLWAPVFPRVMLEIRAFWLQQGMTTVGFMQASCKKNIQVVHINTKLTAVNGVLIETNLF